MTWGTWEVTVLDSAFPGVPEVTVKRLQVSPCHQEGAIPLSPVTDIPGLSIPAVHQPYPHLRNPSGRGWACTAGRGCGLASGPRGQWWPAPGMTATCWCRWLPSGLGPQTTNQRSVPHQTKWRGCPTKNTAGLWPGQSLLPRTRSSLPVMGLYCIRLGLMGTLTGTLVQIFLWMNAHVNMNTYVNIYMNTLLRVTLLWIHMGISVQILEQIILGIYIHSIHRYKHSYERR